MLLLVLIPSLLLLLLLLLPLGMAHLLFLVSLGPHVTSNEGEPLPRMLVRGFVAEGTPPATEKERLDAIQHAAALSAVAEEGNSLWPLSPLLLSSRPSHLVLLKSLFRSTAFSAQMNELLTTAAKQVRSNV